MMSSLMALNALAIDAMLPAFPQISHAFGLVDKNRVQLLIGAYLIGLGIGSIFYGPLSDRYGRRPVILSTVAGYSVFGALCSLSSSFDMLLIFRVIQGSFGAAMGVLVAAVIRDQFEGDAMAKRMSLIFLIFMVVPVIAPTLGQLILYISGWRLIFDLLAIMGVGAIFWVYFRLPETLHREYAVPINLPNIAKSWGEVSMHRGAMGYILGSGLVQGALFGYLNSSQQIFDKIFNAADFFAIGFAIVAIGIAAANFTNSRIVERFGARRVSQSALFCFIILGLLQLLAALLIPTSMPIFLFLLTCNMAMIGFTGSNFGSIAMQPFAKIAGTASSYQNFVKTLIAAILGGFIGQQFNNSLIPMSLGFLITGLLALAFILWSEKGKLFTRPNAPKK
ncbi:Bcr/CflA family drug resistance efflux transporter [Sphingorhabdus lutea]|uniref:Bcr/CflA family efflux transporter n=2 Tax=Sphingorhabdus lutea TaxID=1913578 RepID=A0A1L3JFB1_9SPHN|nr:Bcr/CflA family drug resistance efflux transporter [Sphingorhabdus lutea]